MINMIIKKELKKVSLAILSGVLGFLAFPPFELSSLAWFALVPLLLAVKDSGKRESFWLSYLSGVVFFGSLMHWLVNVTVPGTILLVLVLAIFYGAFGFVASLIIRKSFELLLLPFVWVVLEFIRSVLFSGFPWGILGYTQYENINIIQISDITGAYGVSFLIIAFNVGLYAVATRSKRKIAYLMTPLLFMLLATSYGVYKIQNIKDLKEAEISVVQGNIPQTTKWEEAFAKEIVEKYSHLTAQAASISPDLIIWPETSYPYLVPAGSQVEEISSLNKTLGVPILAGVVYAENGTYYNSALLFERDGTYSDVYRKTHLVPFGEYIPFESLIGFVRGYIDKPIGSYGSGNEKILFSMRSFKESVEPNGERVREMNFLKFGALICFEDVFPYISREYVKNGADFLVNMTNDAWFGETAAAKQHLLASVFRAVENRVPVVRAANTGISAFIDPFGRVVSMVGDDDNVFVAGFDSHVITTVSARRFYTYYGDAFAYFCALMIALVILLEVFFVRKGKGGK